MSRMAIITDGIVSNIVIAGKGFKPPKGSLAIESATANIGDKHGGADSFTKDDLKLSKEELILHAKHRRLVMVKLGMKFNLADDQQIKVDDDMQKDICELAYLADAGERARQENFVMVLQDNRILNLSAEQVIDLRNKIAEHIARSHAILATLVEAINTEKITSIQEIDNPETAGVDSWCEAS